MGSSGMDTSGLLPTVNSPKELLDIVRSVYSMIKKSKIENYRNILDKDIYLLLYMFAKLIAFCGDDKLYHCYTTYLYYHFPQMREVVREYRMSVPLPRILDFILECKKCAKIDHSHNPPSIIISRDLSHRYKDIIRLLKSNVELKNKLIQLLSD